MTAKSLLRSIWAVFALLLMCAPVSTLAQPTDQRAAVAVIKTIYESADISWGNTVFTPQTQALLIQAEEVDEMGLGFDPFIDAQDFDLSDFAYSTESSPSGVNVRVRFLNMGEPRDIRFEMVSTDEGWKIDDMTSHDETGEIWRLTTLLRFVVAQGERRLSAEAFVRGIYISATEIAPRQGRLSPELEAMFEEAEAADAEGLNFNPFIDAAVPEITNIRFGSWLSDEGVFVEAEFTNIIRPVYLIYELRETDEGWRIADIVALSEGREKWRLTTLLQYLIDNPVKAAS